MCPANRSRWARGLAGALLAISVFLSAPAAVAQQIKCPLKLDKFVEELGTDEDLTLLVDDVYGVLFELKDTPGFKVAVLKVRNDVVLLLESEELTYKQSVQALIELLGKGT